MKCPGRSAPTHGPRPLLGRRPRPRVPKSSKLQVVLLLVLLQIFLDRVTTEKVHDQPADLQRVGWNPSERMCESGYYLSVGSEVCRPCLDGVDDTSSPNSKSSCMPCSVCKEDKVEISRCSPTRNTVCQCKPGTFENEDTPEFCLKCTEYDTPGNTQKTQASLCTDNEDEETPCSPTRDRKCVSKDSASVRSDLNLSTVLVIIGVLILALVIILAFVLWKTGALRTVFQYVKRTYSGCEQRDIENANDVQMSLMEVQTPSMGNESHQNMDPEEAERSPTGRKLVPKNETSSFDALKHIFSFCSNNVPYNSWDTFMRKMGLTDIEIQLVRAATPAVEEVLYRMLLKWLNQNGRSASINTLLDALEAVGEKFARDTIEDYAVNSGMFVYQEAIEPAGQVTHASDSNTEETELEGSP